MSSRGEHAALPAILGGYPSGETADHKYAKRAAQRQCRAPHDCHAQSQFVRKSGDFHNLNRGSRKFYHTTSVGISEVPALGVRDQEISENLNTCDRLEFFRINKISVERERFGFAEQLNQAAVFLDQIVR